MKKSPFPTVGEILLEEFLEPLEINQAELARAIGTSRPTISEIVRGERKVTIEISFRLGKFFDLSPEFFFNLQNSHDIRNAKLNAKKLVEKVTAAARDFKRAKLNYVEV